MASRLKNLGILGLSAAGLAFLGLIGYHGIRDSVAGAWNYAWNGFKAEPKATRKYDVSVGSGQHYRFSVPVESETKMDNFLDAHKNTCTPFQVGLELMMADADDGNADGVMSDESVTKLLNSDFCRLAKQYKGELPVVDVAGKVKPKYDMVSPEKRPCVPGH